ncbi:hypothetical protein SAMN06265795_10928 [Noviherbaspirillum humi]|uniref:Uncharacterized protein n=1 Tax=Noviherbaspirillum humi TaxID=1688639 RepID=A0A239IBX5_9BURK|nr:hypothetical protein [Noviherbaspirillum humi]SNS90768.1 hypothetical protein SAMN06265795_10928 [Noviherbaspirillum humi]
MHSLPDIEAACFKALESRYPRLHLMLRSSVDPAAVAEMACLIRLMLAHLEGVSDMSNDQMIAYVRQALQLGSRDEAPALLPKPSRKYAA